MSSDELNTFLTMKDENEYFYNKNDITDIKNTFIYLNINKTESVFIIALKPSKADIISLITTFANNIKSTNVMSTSFKKIYVIYNVFTITIPNDKYYTHYIKAIDKKAKIECDIGETPFLPENIGEDSS